MKKKVGRVGERVATYFLRFLAAALIVYNIFSPDYTLSTARTTPQTEDATLGATRVEELGRSAWGASRG